MGKWLSLIVCGVVLVYGFSAEAGSQCIPYSDAEFREDSSVKLDVSIGRKWCPHNRHVRDWFWDKYHMRKAHWGGESWGYGKPCNVRYPLGRMYNALVALHYMHPSPPKRTSDYRGTLFRWGGNYAARHSDELIPKCKHQPDAMAFWGFWIDDRVELYWPYFYGWNDMVSRAGMLIHEARHIGGDKIHDAGNICNAGMSCDSKWSYGGANTWQAAWLLGFAVESKNVTRKHREYAVNSAEFIMQNHFREPYDFALLPFFKFIARWRSPFR